MAHRPLPALFLAAALAASAASALAAEPVPVLTGLSASPSYAYVGNLKPGNTMTLEAWINPSGWREYSGREKHGLNFMYKGCIGSHIDFVFALQENGILCLGNTYGYIGVMNKRIPAGKWSHVAVTLNNNTGDLRFYINGAYVGNGSGWQGRNPGRKGFLSYTGNELDIGGFNQHGWGYNNDNFKGQIAEVRIWNVVRSDKQIAEAYRRQLTGKETGLMAYWTFADKKDKTGHGWNLTLRGDAKTDAGKGPALDPVAGVSVEMDNPAPGLLLDPGSEVALAAHGSSTSGTISSAMFEVSGRMGDLLLFADVDNAGTNYSASASWQALTSGVYAVTLSVTNSDLKSGAVSKPVYVGVVGPFGGKPFPLPCGIQAESFDVGADGVAYHDLSPANDGGAYRPAEGVDIVALSAANWAVSDAKAGEWLRYSARFSAPRAVAAPSSNLFLITVRVAAKGSGGRFSVVPECDGAAGSPIPFSVPDTGDWKTFKKSCMAAWLPQDMTAFRIVMDANGSSGKVAHFDEIEFEPFIFYLSADSRRFPSSAAASSKQFEVTANANTPWTASTDSPTWITLRTKSGSGERSLIYDISKNTGPDRSGTISVTCAGVTEVYTIYQPGSGPASLSLVSSNRQFSASAAAWKEFDVKANFPWTVKSDSSWIKLRTKSGSGNGRVCFDIAKNEAADRFGTITVSGCGLSAVYSVSQSGVGPASIVLASSRRELPLAAATWKEFSLSANVAWTVKTDSPWIKLRTKSGKNSGKVAYDVTKASASRSGTITVSGGGVSAVYTVVQSAKSAAPRVLPRPVVTASDGSDASAVLDSDPDSAWSPASAAGSWLVLSLPEPLDSPAVSIAGSSIPEDTRVLLSADADGWVDADGAEGFFSYVWILFPPSDGLFSVSSVSLD